MRRCSSLPSGENDNTQQQNRFSLPWYHGLISKRRLHLKTSFSSYGLKNNDYHTRRKPNGTKPVTKETPEPQDISTHALSTNDDEGFTLYPNPAQDILNVKTLDAEIDNIKIFSAFGMLVKEMKKLDNNSSINVSNLKTGTYFIRFVSGETIVTRKFVKK